MILNQLFQEVLIDNTYAIATPICQTQKKTTSYNDFLYHFIFTVKTVWLSCLIISWCIPLSSFCQLSDTYTIGGTSPDYVNLTDAVNALSQNGINTSVVFNIRSGTYNEQVAIEEIVGVSSSNKITIQSETGNAADVLLTYNSPSSNNYLIKLDGAALLIVFLTETMIRQFIPQAARLIKTFILKIMNLTTIKEVFI